MRSVKRLDEQIQGLGEARMGTARCPDAPHVAWGGLSGACHHHVYDLAPTREELQGWRDTVLEVVDCTERAWR